MTHDKIKQAFNKAADSYDDYCHLQRQTGKKLVSLVKQHYVNSSRIIDLGCGSGLVTRELAEALNYVDFHAIDFADQLLMKAKKHLSPFKLTIYESDFDSLTEHHFDIIFSNLSIHWSTNLALTLQKLSASLSKDGILAFSIPLSGSLIELQKFTIKSFMTESATINLIHQNKYTLLASQTEQIIFEFDTFLQALKSIKGVGANYTDRQTSGLSSHPLMKQMIKSNEKVSLTYKIGYFIVRR